MQKPEEQLVVKFDELDESYKKIHSKSKSREEHDKDAEGKDLYEDVCNIFVEAGHPHPEAWTNNKLNHDEIKDLPMSRQRLAINRRLRLKLAEDEDDTRMHRYVMLDTGSYEDWLSSIRPGVFKIARHDGYYTGEEDDTNINHDSDEHDSSTDSIDSDSHSDTI